MRARPLSPYLSVYKMSRYTLVTSIFNRFTGVGLSLGLVLLVYWLTAVAGGPLAQARAARLLALPVMKLVYAACIVAFCYHLVAGIRHLVWDTGRFLERAQSRSSARLVVAVSVALMALIGYCVFVRGGRLP
ncbi:MAG: succinate dehydrogenase, cytochrome b556 subunit [Steroidobacteraceae bacterium]|jgi:succinate dehydrogenase / fumarate reductase, cytochrome b subunit